MQSTTDHDTVVDPAVKVGKDVNACPECGQRFSAEATFCPFDGSKLVVSCYQPGVDPLLGTTIDGRYEVIGVVGEGGMGTVYEVRHKMLGRTFAMKLLRRDLAREADLAARFINEAKATGSIKHPHIVSITDFGRLDDTTPFFVMEMLVGRTLAQVLKECGPLDVVRTRSIVLQIASALAQAHESGVIHRDLKPENVFLARPAGGSLSGAEDDVKIVDFGAAKVLGSSRITKTGIVFGTPHYMSPEQASGQSVDHRADIYALGVILYEMLTGRVPFEAETYMGVLTQHMFVKPKPPSTVVPARADQLGSLEDIALRALEKKPEDRYQTMHGLAVDLEKGARGESVARSIRPSTSKSFGLDSAGRLSNPLGDDAVLAPGVVPKRPVALFALLGALVGVVALLVLSFVRRHTSEEAIPRPSPSTVDTRPSSTPLLAAPALIAAPSAPASMNIPSASASAPLPAPLAPVGAVASATRARGAGPASPSPHTNPAPERTAVHRPIAGELPDPWEK
jgi:eukaryotic-like serine/threonine-protein kinase